MTLTGFARRRREAASEQTPETPAKAPAKAKDAAKATGEGKDKAPKAEAQDKAPSAGK